MKKWLIVIASVAALALWTPTNAHAGDEGWAALGGFIGGALLSGWGHHGYTVHHYSPPVIHERVVVREPVSRGHYEYRRQKEWVRGYWSYEENACGRVSKIWTPGHYRSTRVKVWVPHYQEYTSHSRRYRSCR